MSGAEKFKGAQCSFIKLAYTSEIQFSQHATAILEAAAKAVPSLGLDSRFVAYANSLFQWRRAAESFVHTQHFLLAAGIVTRNCILSTGTDESFSQKSKAFIVPRASNLSFP